MGSAPASGIPKPVTLRFRGRRTSHTRLNLPITTRMGNPPQVSESNPSRSVTDGIHNESQVICEPKDNAMKTLVNLLILAAALLTDIPTARAEAVFISVPVGYTGPDPAPGHSIDRLHDRRCG